MISLLLAAALAFPLPISLPRPVSPLTWAATLVPQTSPAVGSNGSMRFVAWGDARGGRHFAFGTRVSADGAPLDPLGIMIPEIEQPDAVIWTGAEFAVIGATKTARAVVFVGTDGTVSAATPVDVSREYQLVAVSDPGPEARLLFLKYNSNTILDGRIVSARGELLVSISTPLSAPLALPPIGSRFIGAGRRNDFAVFGPSASILVDRDGHVLANRAVSWPFDYFFTENIAVAGTDGHGFVLLRQPGLYPSATVLACQLANDAAFTGKTALLPLPWTWHLAQSRPAIAPVRDGYMVVNQATYGDNTVHEYVTRLSFDLTAQTEEVTDAGWPLLLTMDGGGPMLVTSIGPALYLQTLSGPAESQKPVLLNLSPPTQFDVVIAAASSGYAVAWVQRVAPVYSQASLKTYIRRFSMTGESLDAAPLEVDGARAYASLPVLTATADVYVVNGRRLDASTGQWIDSPPVADVIAAASNGSEALLAVATPKGTALQQLSSRGTASVPTLLPASASGPIAITPEGLFRVNLASNGIDYLVVWNTFFGCVSLCGRPPTAVYALRVRADGTWIDASPTQLTSDGWRPSVAWAGGSYVVTWSGATGVHATRVSISGSVLDGTGNGVVIERTDPKKEDVSAAVVSLGSDAILLIHHQQWDGSASWVAMRFNPNDLAGAATVARTTLPSDSSAAAAAAGGQVVLAYSRNSGASTGYVERVFAQHFAESVARRRAIAQ